MTIRIGANPIGWSNDDLQDIGAHISLETCLKQAQAIGFEGMELGHKFPRNATALKEALAPYTMACVGGWHSLSLLEREAEAEFEAARPHRELLKAMGTSVFIVAETSNAIYGLRDVPLSKRPHLSDAEWKIFGARMTRLAYLLQREGLQLAYHHHMGTVVQSADDINAFMAATGPSVHLLLDTGHATWGGDDPARLAQHFHARISHVHVKDVRPDIMAQASAEDWSFLYAVLGKADAFGIYTVPGDGMVDYTRFFKALSPYSGWVIVEAEQDPLKADPVLYATKGMSHLRQCLKEAGL
ncbi:MAG: myo-inosose-2 dehydratase [Rhizobiales bacterium]|nr:myo-inosose-2 dehydratase [Hyphomicrobiales bacterium]